MSTRRNRTVKRRMKRLKFIREAVRSLKQVIFAHGISRRLDADLYDLNYLARLARKAKG